MPLIQQGDEKSFSQLIGESIIEGLTNLIGRSGSMAIIINFRLEEKIMDPRAFHEAMMSAMRESGAMILEKAILKEIHRKLGTRFEPALPFDFEKEFNATKRLFLNGDLCQYHQSLPLSDRRT